MPDPQQPGKSAPSDVIIEQRTTGARDDRLQPQ